jgi:hypothetical protein
VFLGRSCDDIGRFGRVVDDIPPPHVPSAHYGKVDDFATAAAKGADLPTGSGTMHLPTGAGAVEAEQTAIAGGRVTGEEILVFHTGIHPRVAVDLPASNPRLLALFPQNLREYRAVYGIEATASAEAQILKMNRRFASALDVERLKPGERLADVLVAQDAPSPLVILGHSEEQGGVLVLPSGARISVVDVHNRCSAAGKLCIVLTCHGEDLHLDKELAPRDALAMWRAAQAKNRTSPMSIAEFALAMRQDQVTRETRRQIAVSGVGTGVVAGAGGTYVYIAGRKR